MARTKGSTNKKAVKVEETTEPKVIKKRGRQKGQKIEREPAITIELNKNYIIKMDKNNWTLYAKIKKDEKPEINEEIEDDDIEKEPGLRFIGHFGKKISEFENLFEALRSDLLLNKCKKENKKESKEEQKENIILAERFIELIKESHNEAFKLFSKLEVYGVIITKNKETNEKKKVGQ